MSESLYEIIQFRFGNPDDFVSGLRSRMRLHKISQGRLAKRSGFAPCHVSRWIGRNASVTPELETRLILDEALEALIAGR